MNEYQAPIYPTTGTDHYLKERGYHMLDEVARALKTAEMNLSHPMLDIATGGGRMAYTLASQGYTTLTGDISEEVLARAISRIAAFFPGKLSFTLLNAYNLPFPDGSYSGLTSANALHEVEDPMRMVQEMTRVCSLDGSLLILDFNDNGFEVIEKAHWEIQNREHPRGSADYDEIDCYLRNHFREVRFHTLPLNCYWVAHLRR